MTENRGQLVEFGSGNAEFGKCKGHRTEGRNKMAEVRRQIIEVGIRNGEVGKIGQWAENNEVGSRIQISLRYALCPMLSAMSY